SFGSLTRNAGSGGTINFSGTNLGASTGTFSQILFSSFIAPAGLIGTAQPGGTGVLGFATVTAGAVTEVATYGTNGGATYTGTGTICTSAALGTGTVTLTAGTVQTANSSGVLLTNAVNFNNANGTLGGSNPLLFGAGTVTLNGTNNVLNVTNTAVTNFNNVIT